MIRGTDAARFRYTRERKLTSKERIGTIQTAIHDDTLTHLFGLAEAVETWPRSEKGKDS